MEERDKRILQHIGLYYISLRLVVERLFFDGNSTAAGNVIARLQKQNRIITRARAFPGGISYYQLTASATQELGLPEYRAKAPSGQALPDHLAVLWFCTMNESKRRRVEKKQLEQVFGGITFPGPHSVEKNEAGDFRLLRVFAHSADDDYQLRQVRTHLAEVESRGFYDWLKTGKYGVALLTDTETRCEKLSQQVHNLKLHDQTHCVVEVAPTSLTLREVLNAC